MYATLSVAEALAPATTYEFPAQKDEEVPYSSFCIAARGENNQDRSLSLSRLDDTQFICQLQGLLPEGERTYYAPTVAAMSGAVFPQKPFTDIYTVDRLRRIARPGYVGTTNARLPCDGTVIGRSDGFLMSAGGCPLIVLSGVGQDGPVCIAAHAGRYSLIDPFVLNKKKGARTHFSVVNAMVAYARKHYRARSENLILRSFFSLPSARYPHDLRDPKHGRKSARLQECLKKRNLAGALARRDDGVVCLSLSELIRLQAEAERVGKIDTSRLSLPANGNFAYTQHPETEMRTARNLVVLTRS